MLKKYAGVEGIVETFHTRNFTRVDFFTASLKDFFHRACSNQISGFPAEQADNFAIRLYCHIGGGLHKIIPQLEHSTHLTEWNEAIRGMLKKNVDTETIRNIEDISRDCITQILLRGITDKILPEYADLMRKYVEFGHDQILNPSDFNFCKSNIEGIMHSIKMASIYFNTASSLMEEQITVPLVGNRYQPVNLELLACDVIDKSIISLRCS